MKKCNPMSGFQTLQKVTNQGLWLTHFQKLEHTLTLFEEKIRATQNQNHATSRISISYAEVVEFVNLYAILHSWLKALYVILHPQYFEYLHKWETLELDRRIEHIWNFVALQHEKLKKSDNQKLDNIISYFENSTTSINLDFEVDSRISLYWEMYRKNLLDPTTQNNTHQFLSKALPNLSKRAWTSLRQQLPNIAKTLSSRSEEELVLLSNFKNEWSQQQNKFWNRSLFKKQIQQNEYYTTYFDQEVWDELLIGNQEYNSYDFDIQWEEGLRSIQNCIYNREFEKMMNELIQHSEVELLPYNSGLIRGANTYFHLDEESDLQCIFVFKHNRNDETVPFSQIVSNISHAIQNYKLYKEKDIMSVYVPCYTKYQSELLPQYIQYKLGASHDLLDIQTFVQKNHLEYSSRLKYLRTTDCLILIWLQELCELKHPNTHISVSELFQSVLLGSHKNQHTDSIVSSEWVLLLNATNIEMMLNMLAKECAWQKAQKDVSEQHKTPAIPFFDT